MKVLLVSADPRVREQMSLAVRSVRRTIGQGEPFELLEASDGVRGMALAWRHVPDVVVADQITSRAGAFALTRELKGAQRPHPARIVILLDRTVDEWLARWAGADAWFVKPVDPFALADAVRGFFEVPKEEAG
jgi:DNA-binding response OmpR family regulator